MTASVTPEQLNRATLDRQLLLERHELEPREAVRRILAVQAQSPPSLYISMWSRLHRFDPAQIDEALTASELVRATLMRITLHVVHADDYANLHTAMQPTLRGARLNDRRYTETGLTPADADAVLPELLELLARPHSNAEVETWLSERFGDGGRWAWWALRHYAPVRHHPIGGPWSFGERPAYVAAGAPARTYDIEESDRALEGLVERYLGSFGPASVADVAQFGLVHRGRVRPAIERLGDRLERYVGPGGTELFDLAGSQIPDGDTPTPVRLLPMWDSTLLAYHDRSRIIPEQLRRIVIRNNGDVLPTVLVDGKVAGIWRTVEEGDNLGVEITALQPFNRETWEALEPEAQSLLNLVGGRDATPYDRYRRWWPSLAEHAAQTQVLPG